MAERLVRTIACADLQVRTDQRTITGIAVPYGTETRIMERGRAYTETFVRGAFARTITERGPGRVKVLVQHDRETLPIGVATLLREDTTGLYGEFRISATRQGDEVLELVRDGAVDSFSVGFRPIRDKWFAHTLETHVTSRRRFIETHAYRFILRSVSPIHLMTRKAW